MQQPTYQTVRLSRGRHTSPTRGACVMELASMLAGEAFSDRPQSVSRPLGAFLRTYNDMLDDERRQDLYLYAALAVGTAAGEHIEHARAARLIAWAEQRWKRRARWSPLARLKRRAARKVLRDDWESAARYAIRSLGSMSAETHLAVLALIDELVALGTAAAPDAAAIQPRAAWEPVHEPPVRT